MWSQSTGEISRAVGIQATWSGGDGALEQIGLISYLNLEIKWEMYNVWRCGQEQCEVLAGSVCRQTLVVGVVSMSLLPRLWSLDSATSTHLLTVN